jgi:hypothetical protein
MAQTGFTPIQLYYSSTTTNAPTAGNLASGELAINITDGKLFYKDNANVVQVIGWKTVPATAGGTGQTSYAVGDLLYADTTTTLAKLPDVATGNALISGGVSTAPSWGKIGLTTHVSGVLPVANGGTNASTASIAAFNNITGYSAAGATGTTSTNLVFSTSPTITTPTLAGDVNLSTGNITQGTAAKGINFSANTPLAGKTSTLLNWYEEGTWTPTDVSGAGLTFTQNATATYVKVGSQVTFAMDITFPVTADTSFVSISFPFTGLSSASYVGQIGYQTFGFYLSPSGGGAGFNFWDANGNAQRNVNVSGKRFQISFTYRAQ